MSETQPTTSGRSSKDTNGGYRQPDPDDESGGDDTADLYDERRRTPSLANQPGESLANQKPAVPMALVLQKAILTLPFLKAFVMDEAVNKEISGLFKGMNLTQDSRLRASLTSIQLRPPKLLMSRIKFWQETQEKWVKEVKSDPQLGPRLNEVKTTISRGHRWPGRSEACSIVQGSYGLYRRWKQPCVYPYLLEACSNGNRRSACAGNGPSAAGPTTARGNSLCRSSYVP